MKNEKQENLQQTNDLISSVFNGTKDIFDKVSSEYIKKEREREKKINVVIKNSKEKINSFFRENEIFSKEVQLMWKKSLKGDIDDTIELFKVCLTTLENSVDNKYEIDELWSWIPELINKYKTYIYYKEISFNGKRPKHIPEFIVAFENLNMYIAHNIIEINSFINKCLKSTIIFTRKIKGMSVAGEFDVSNDLDEVSNENLENENNSEENGNTENASEGTEDDEDKEWI